MEFCCEDMKNNVWMPNQPNIGEIALCYSAIFNEYGLLNSDYLFNEDSLLCSDYLSMVPIGYCPWCGSRLPNSLRERWSSELESLGYKPPLCDDTIPIEYRSDAWWNKLDNSGTV